MKLIIIVAIFAVICMIQSAPSTTSSKRPQLILQGYDDEVPVIDVDSEDNEDEDEIDTTTTTTTTTRRTTFTFPTRRVITTTRSRKGKSTMTPRTTTIDIDEIIEEHENSNSFDGDFRYFRNIREFVKKIIEDLKKLIKNISIQDIMKVVQQFFVRKEED
ncbi:hypothetical protein I4U23_025829 [Adineta vaga]|nr:hypothetical protein I4U23_025829 [Adineta vaga]